MVGLQALAHKLSQKALVSKHSAKKKIIVLFTDGELIYQAFYIRSLNQLQSHIVNRRLAATDVDEDIHLSKQLIGSNEALADTFKCYLGCIQIKLVMTASIDINEIIESLD